MKQFMKKFAWETKQNPAKLLQYFMLLFLFILAFFLPFYGTGRQVRESAARINQERLLPGEARTDSGDEAGGLRKTEEKMEKVHSDKGTIVLDAGHGGFDSGMVGKSGISEKELNLIYAQKLEILLTEAGYRVVQTRETQEGLYDADEPNKKAQDMQKRCAVIAEEKPLVTISIHQNSYPEDEAVCGPQVFYYEQSKEGEKLAAAIQTQLNAMQHVMRQRVQKGNSTYYILKRSASTTVIVECGFLTNVQEEALLAEEDYQNQVVEAICKGILEYLDKR